MSATDRRRGARVATLTELWRILEERGAISHAMVLEGVSDQVVEELITEAERRLRDVAAVSR